MLWLRWAGAVGVHPPLRVVPFSWDTFSLFLSLCLGRGGFTAARLGV